MGEFLLNVDPGSTNQVLNFSLLMTDGWLNNTKAKFSAVS